MTLPDGYEIVEQGRTKVDSTPYVMLRHIATGTYCRGYGADEAAVVQGALNALQCVVESPLPVACSITGDPS